MTLCAGPCRIIIIRTVFRLKDRCQAANRIKKTSQGHVILFSLINSREKKTHQNWDGFPTISRYQRRNRHPGYLDPGVPNWLAHARDRGKACLVALVAKNCRASNGFPLSRTISLYLILDNTIFDSTATWYGIVNLYTSNKRFHT